MNSRQSMSIAGESFICLSNRVFDIAIQQGIETGTRTAVEYIEEQKKELRKGRYDRRLRNTRLLLRNYRNLKMHVQGAVFDPKQVKENAIDILDGLDDFDYDDNVYIESIKRSQQRTMIIMRHIDEMLKYYRISCEQSSKPEDLRRYKVMMAHYIDEDEKSAIELSSIHIIDKRTVYKDIDIAIKKVSALIFGIDSLKLY